MLPQVTERRTIIQGNLFTEGDIAIAVQWYDRLPIDPQGLKFRKWTPPREPGEEPVPPTIMNSTELRAIDLSVRPFVSSIGPALVRHSLRLVPKKSGTRAAVVHSARSSGVVELPDDTVYDIHADADALVRRECW